MVTEKKIKQLIQKQSPHLVTISLPTEKKGLERQQNPIRFKNLLAAAEQQLKEKGLKQEAIRKLLEPAMDLSGGLPFWQDVDRGLVVYLADDGYEVFKLPYPTTELAYVHNHYRITPLLPMISTSGTFSILSISRETVRLLRCTRSQVVDITPETVPVSFREWLQEAPEPHLQFHTGNSGDAAIYFGHGATDEDRKELVGQYFRDTDRAITPVMNKLNDPLLPAGLPSNLSLYRKVNRYPRLMDQAFEKNPDGYSDAKLRDCGWEIVREHLLSDLYTSLETIRENPSGRTSRDPSEIIPSTIMGKAEALFLRSDAIRWGQYDSENHRVQYHNQPGDGDVDLMNWLSIKALATGSRVYMLPPEDMPDRAEAAALYRY